MADPLKVRRSEFEELRRLRAENAELKVQKEILREAAAYVARGDDPVCRFRFAGRAPGAWGFKRPCRSSGSRFRELGASSARSTADVSAMLRRR